MTTAIVGMKTAHIGVDVASAVVHRVVGTAANKADINQKAAALHGAEEDVFADAGYTGAEPISGRNMRTAMSAGTSQSSAASSKHCLRAYPSRKGCSVPRRIWHGEKDFTEDHAAACSG